MSKEFLTTRYVWHSNRLDNPDEMVISPRKPHWDGDRVAVDPDATVWYVHKSTIEKILGYHIPQGDNGLIMKYQISNAEFIHLEKDRLSEAIKGE